MRQRRLPRIDDAISRACHQCCADWRRHRSHTMIYPELFKQLEAVRWTLERDMLFERPMPNVHALNRYRKQLIARRAELAVGAG